MSTQLANPTTRIGSSGAGNGSSAVKLTGQSGVARIKWGSGLSQYKPPHTPSSAWTSTGKARTTSLVPKTTGSVGFGASKYSGLKPIAQSTTQQLRNNLIPRASRHSATGIPKLGVGLTPKIAPTVPKTGLGRFLSPLGRVAGPLGKIAGPLGVVGDVLGNQKPLSPGDRIPANRRLEEIATGFTRGQKRTNRPLKPVQNSPYGYGDLPGLAPIPGDGGNWRNRQGDFVAGKFYRFQGEDVRGVSDPVQYQLKYPVVYDIQAPITFQTFQSTPDADTGQSNTWTTANGITIDANIYSNNYNYTTNRYEAKLSRTIRTSVSPSPGNTSPWPNVAGGTREPLPQPLGNSADDGAAGFQNGLLGQALPDPSLLPFSSALGGLPGIGLNPDLEPIPEPLSLPSASPLPGVGFPRIAPNVTPRPKQLDTEGIPQPTNPAIPAGVPFPLAPIPGTPVSPSPGINPPVKIFPKPISGNTTIPTPGKLGGVPVVNPLNSGSNLVPGNTGDKDRDNRITQGQNSGGGDKCPDNCRYEDPCAQPCIQEIMSAVTGNFTGALEAGRCEEGSVPDFFPYAGKGIDGVVSIVEALSEQLDRVRELVCEKSEVSFALPMLDEIKIGQDRPVAVLVWGEINTDGSTGRSRWSTQIPYYRHGSGHVPAIPEYKKGSYYAKAVAEDNSKIWIYAATEQEAETQLQHLIALADPNKFRNTITSTGKVSKALREVNIRPLYLQYWSKGKNQPVFDWSVKLT